MLRVGYCEVSDLQLSPASRTAVSEVHDIINRGECWALRLLQHRSIRYFLVQV